MIFDKISLRPSFSINRDAQLLIACSLAVLITFILIAGFWGIRYTQYDDLTFLQGRWYHGDHFTSAAATAHSQGRIQFMLGTALVSSVSFFADTVFYDILHYGTLFLTILLLGVVIAVYSRLTHGLMAVIFFAGTVVLSWNHTMLTAGPMWFFLSISMLFISLLCLRHYQLKGQWPYLIISLAALSLTYVAQEFQPPLATLLWGIACLSDPKQQNAPIKTRLIKSWRLLSAAAVLIAVWFGAYVWFRLYYGTSYEGASLPTAEFVAAMKSPPFSFDLFLKAMVMLSSSSSSYFFGFNGFSYGFTDPMLEGQLIKIRTWPPSDWLYPVLHWQYLAMGTIAFIATWLVLRNTEKMPRRITLLWLLIGVAAMFFPNALVAIVPRYQQWVEFGTKAYAYTVYSHFGLTIIVATAGIWLVSAVPLRLRRLAILGFSFFIAVGVWGAAYQNDIVGEGMHRATDKWKGMDYAMKTQAFRDIMADTTIIAPHISSHYWSVPIPPDWWDRYAKNKYGIQATFLRDVPVGKKYRNSEFLYFDVMNVDGCDTRAVIAGQMQQFQNRMWIENPRVGLIGDRRAVYFAAYEDNGETRTIPIYRNKPKYITVVSGPDYVFDVPGRYALDTLQFNCMPRAAGLSPAILYPYGLKMDLRHKRLPGAVFLDGWADPEESHRWSVGKNATLTVEYQVPARQDLKAVLETGLWLHPPRLQSQRVGVKVNGEIVANLMMTKGTMAEPVPYAFTIPAKVWNKANPAKITFLLPDASPPSESGSPDTRDLALAVRFLTLGNPLK